jgi:hypothetical protein
MARYGRAWSGVGHSGQLLPMSALDGRCWTGIPARLEAHTEHSLGMLSTVYFDVPMA